MNLETTFLNKLEKEKKTLQEAIEAEYKLLASLEKKDFKIRSQNRLLYTGLGYVLSAVTITGFILYRLVVNPQFPVMASEIVVFLYLFGLGIIAAWMIET